jgi:probable rRNA maturation factor
MMKKRVLWCILLSLCICIDLVVTDPIVLDTDILDQEQITFLFNSVLLNTKKSFEAPLHATIVVMNDADIAQYNQQFRQKNQPTNVLAFPTVERGEPWPVWPDHPILLGDIFISWPRVISEAQAQGKTRHHHAMHLLIHGFLHLLHYDHETEDEAGEMEDTERAVFQQMGWPDPYGDDHFGVADFHLSGPFTSQSLSQEVH